MKWCVSTKLDYFFTDARLRVLYPLPKKKRKKITVLNECHFVSFFFFRIVFRSQWLAKKAFFKKKKKQNKKEANKRKYLAKCQLSRGMEWFKIFLLIWGGQKESTTENDKKLNEKSCTENSVKQKLYSVRFINHSVLLIIT